ncbi:hypothetical protein KGA66_09290 [Actinocrinis puniceicyclus]|uniref:Uncharacterized protein n=1 Tax=Actinocrinis puniceicyclus TaxID=977794 RepID=A0A8J7WNV6_9ACTN|nr:hypothetical protein [Actinocrinis puniceicyclus]MBS2963239.1 hypothetical protein [Actinocrinis puniceicyclus]
MTVPSTLTQSGPQTQVPDVHNLPLGERSEERLSATAAIRERVLRKTGSGVTAAAFQSSI